MALKHPQSLFESLSLILINRLSLHLFYYFQFHFLTSLHFSSTWTPQNSRSLWCPSGRLLQTMEDCRWLGQRFLGFVVGLHSLCWCFIWHHFTAVQSFVWTVTFDSEFIELFACWCFPYLLGTTSPFSAETAGLSSIFHQSVTSLKFISTVFNYYTVVVVVKFVRFRFVLKFDLEPLIFNPALITVSLFVSWFTVIAFTFGFPLFGVTSLFHPVFSFCSAFMFQARRAFLTAHSIIWALQCFSLLLELFVVLWFELLETALCIVRFHFPTAISWILLILVFLAGCLICLMIVIMCYVSLMWNNYQY